MTALDFYKNRLKDRGFSEKQIKDLTDHKDLPWLQFAEDYHTKQLILSGVSNRLSKMEEAGKEATSLIAHLKDQHGFNDEEQASQDKIMDVFKYEGRW